MRRVQREGPISPGEFEFRGARLPSVTPAPSRAAASMSTSPDSPLPLSSHGKPVDVFEQAVELEAELRRTVRGEVRFDEGSRALYATDGSNYRQVPIGL